MPPRTTRKSYRPRVSDRTMVGTAQPLCLFACGTEGRRHRDPMNLRKRQIHSASLHYLGWTERPFPQRLPVAGEVFFLTSPFIERGNRKSEPLLQMSGRGLKHRDVFLDTQPSGVDHDMFAQQSLEHDWLAIQSAVRAKSDPEIAKMT